MICRSGSATRNQFGGHFESWKFEHVVWAGGAADLTANNLDTSSTLCGFEPEPAAKAGGPGDQRNHKETLYTIEGQLEARLSPAGWWLIIIFFF